MNKPTEAGPEMDRAIKKILSKPGGLANVGYYSTSPAWAVTGLMWFCEANGCEFCVDTIHGSNCCEIVDREGNLLGGSEAAPLALVICRALLSAAEKTKSPDTRSQR